MKNVRRRKNELTCQIRLNPERTYGCTCGSWLTTHVLQRKDERDASRRLLMQYCRGVRGGGETFNVTLDKVIDMVISVIFSTGEREGERVVKWYRVLAAAEGGSRHMTRQSFSVICSLSSCVLACGLRLFLVAARSPITTKRVRRATNEVPIR